MFGYKIDILHLSQKSGGCIKLSVESRVCSSCMRVSREHPPMLHRRRLNGPVDNPDWTVRRHRDVISKGCFRSRIREIARAFADFRPHTATAILSLGKTLGSLAQLLARPAARRTR